MVNDKKLVPVRIQKNKIQSFDRRLVQRHRLDSGGSLERWHTLTCVSTLPQFDVGMTQATFSEV